MAVIRDCWHGQHQSGRALASQNQEAKELPQNREKSFASGQPPVKDISKMLSS